MKKIAAIIQQIELAQNLLTLQCDKQCLQLSQQHLLSILAVYQKVSLAEINVQVKNTRSHISSTNE